MYIRDRLHGVVPQGHRVDVGVVLVVEPGRHGPRARVDGCLLYTSVAADERSRVDLGGRRFITKKKNNILYISVVPEQFKRKINVRLLTSKKNYEKEKNRLTEGSR